MRRIRIFHQGAPENGIILLDVENVHYIKDVLRLKDDSIIEVLCKNNELYSGRVAKDGKRYIVRDLVKQEIILDNRPVINLFIGSIKGSAMDYAIEKASEIGATSLTPVYCEFSSSRKITDEKLERFRRIAVASAVQSRRASPLLINKAVEFEEIFDPEPIGNNIFLHPYVNNPLSRFFRTQIDFQKPFNIFSGPEGGFSDREIRKFGSFGFFGASIGSNILRAETIPLVICSVILYEYDRRFFDG